MKKRNFNTLMSILGASLIIVKVFGLTVAPWAIILLPYFAIFLGWLTGIIENGHKLSRGEKVEDKKYNPAVVNSVLYMYLFIIISNVFGLVGLDWFKLMAPVYIAAGLSLIGIAKKALKQTK